MVVYTMKIPLLSGRVTAFNINVRVLSIEITGDGFALVKYTKTVPYLR